MAGVILLFILAVVVYWIAGLDGPKAIQATLVLALVFHGFAQHGTSKRVTELRESVERNHATLASLLQELKRVSRGGP